VRRTPVVSTPLSPPTAPLRGGDRCARATSGASRRMGGPLGPVLLERRTGTARVVPSGYDGATEGQERFLETVWFPGPHGREVVMFVGHLGVGLALASRSPRFRLGTLLGAAMLLDALLGVFVLAGMEQVIVPPSFGNARYLEFVFPYSHGLLNSHALGGHHRGPGWCRLAPDRSGCGRRLDRRGSGLLALPLRRGGARAGASAASARIPLTSRWGCGRPSPGRSRSSCCCSWRGGALPALPPGPVPAAARRAPRPCSGCSPFCSSGSARRGHASTSARARGELDRPDRGAGAARPLGGPGAVTAPAVAAPGG
jgi:hypothetical protein